VNFFHILLLGIVEGITEFLPISSTAHLIIASRLLELSQTEFLKSFQISIQLGAILAVVFLYRRSFFMNPTLLWKIFAAFIPTAVIGLLLYSVIKNIFFESITLILLTLLLGGVALIVFDLFHTEKKDAQAQLENISLPQAFLIGCFQSIAMVPGVSRAAASIIGGLFAGLNRKASIEFSFLLAVPTMLSATGLELLRNGTSFTQQEFLFLGIGLITSFFTAILAIKWLLHFIQIHSFILFGVYRMIVATVILLLFIL